MPQITQTDYDWLRSHKEHIIRRNRYLTHIATFLIWLGVSVGNYYFLASFATITWSIRILLFEFEIALFIVTAYGLLKLNHRRFTDDSVSVATAFAFAIAAASFAFAIAATAFAFAIAAASFALADSKEMKSCPK